MNIHRDQILSPGRGTASLFHRSTGMVAFTREQMKKYVQLWADNGELLERVREEDIRKANTTQAILMFENSFRVALRDLPPRETSGLAEWQRYMKIWRERGRSNRSSVFIAEAD